jgi:hypothetical protein
MELEELRNKKLRILCRDWKRFGLILTKRGPIVIATRQPCYMMELFLRGSQDWRNEKSSFGLEYVETA